MKIKSGFELREVCGEKLIVAQGLENLDFSKMINLNETGAFIWQSTLGGEFTEEDLVEKLCEEYEVDKATAATDVHAFIESLKAEGIVED